MRNQRLTYATYQPLTNERYSSGQPAEAAAWHPIKFLLAEVVSLLAAGAVSALILFFWWWGISDPCPGFILGDPATGGADARLATQATTIVFASLSVLVLAGFVVFLCRARLRRPFLMLVVGFPVYYLTLLVLISVAARVVWGPTRC